MHKLNDETFTIQMDIEGFHSFVKYLISRGHGGMAGNGRLGPLQRHWLRYIDVCKGNYLKYHETPLSTGQKIVK